MGPVVRQPVFFYCSLKGVTLEVSDSGLRNYGDNMDTYSFFISLVIIIILISIQFTLNMILKEIKSLRNSIVWRRDERYDDERRNIQ